MDQKKRNSLENKKNGIVKTPHHLLAHWTMPAHLPAGWIWALIGDGSELEEEELEEEEEADDDDDEPLIWCFSEKEGERK